jgi:hypothetical protein
LLGSRFFLCCGGLFATTSTARSKRAHASDSSAVSAGFFAMTEPTYTTPEDELLFSSIGRLTISWARLEVALDALITIIHHRVGGKSIETEMPWMLARKLKYIRKCFAKLGPLKLYAQGVSELMEEIRLASEMRQNIIHGISLHHPEGATVLKMARLVRGGEHYTAHVFEVSSMEIIESAVAVIRLSNRVTALCKSLIAIFGIDKFKQADSKLPR